MQDEDHKRLKDYTAEVINDELIVKDENGDLFTFNPKNAESQRVQKTLFHEKQKLIENCLFGVDINPNSVKICRLRLWIELLKNAYYKGENELETLPNIDINIKCGNSLVSRFALDADLKDALKKSKWNIDTYRLLVTTYRHAQNKEEKREMERLINDIKNDFRSEIGKNDPLIKQKNKLQGEFFNLSQETLFPRTDKEQAEVNKKIQKLSDDIYKVEAEIESVKSNKIYENAFEWRFEFPEVLNDDGDFIGFDVVIGNPPYLRVREENDFVRNYYFDNYSVSENQLDLYHLFIEKSFNISNKTSYHSLIVPNAFLANKNNIRLREFILNSFTLTKIIDLKDDVFEEASVEVLIFLFSKPKFEMNGEYYEAIQGDILFKNYFQSKDFVGNSNKNFTITIDSEKQSIIEKVLINSVKFSDLFETISGIKEYQVGKGKPPQVSEQVKNKVFNATNKKDESYIPEIRGKNLQKYYYVWENEYISYGPWLAEPRTFNYFLGEKIVVRQIPSKKSLVASFIKDTFVIDQTGYIAKPKANIDLLFYLALINSRLIFWYFQNINNEFDNLFPKIKMGEINDLPIHKGSEKYNKIIADTTNQILTLKSHDPSTDTSALEAEIDEMVYDLYGLTEEERKIVERA